MEEKTQKKTEAGHLNRAHLEGILLSCVRKDSGATLNICSFQIQKDEGKIKPVNLMRHVIRLEDITSRPGYLEKLAEGRNKLISLECELAYNRDKGNMEVTASESNMKELSSPTGRTNTLELSGTVTRCECNDAFATAVIQLEDRNGMTLLAVTNAFAKEDERTYTAIRNHKIKQGTELLIKGSLDSLTMKGGDKVQTRLVARIAESQLIRKESQETNKSTRMKI